MNAHTPKLIAGLIASGLAALGGAALAQAPAAAPAAPAAALAPVMGPGVTAEEGRNRPPRARGIATDLAIEAAVAANAACLAKGAKTVALVTDSVGVPIVLIAADGTPVIIQRISMGKAQVTLKYKVPSSAISARVAAEPALAAELAADPAIRASRPGAIPITVGSEIVGVLSVAGAPSGATDEACAVAALDKIKDRVK